MFHSVIYEFGFDCLRRVRICVMFDGMFLFFIGNLMVKQWRMSQIQAIFVVVVVMAHGVQALSDMILLFGMFWLL